jgi:hypothetical protein
MRAFSARSHDERADAPSNYAAFSFYNLMARVRRHFVNQVDAEFERLMSGQRYPANGFISLLLKT